MYGEGINAVGARLALLVCVSACGSRQSPTELADAGRADASVPAIAEPEIRFVRGGQTLLSRGPGQVATVVIDSSYAGPPVLARAWSDNPWDLFDPISKQHLAVFRTSGNQHGLFAVNGDQLVEVLFDELPSTLTEEPPAWGVMSADGMLVYLSTGTRAYVAKRKSEALAFGAAQELGSDIGIIHDVSPDGTLVLASGHLPIKWGTPTNIAAPRRVGIFEIDEDGRVTRDVSAEHPPLNDYMQVPTFLGDSRGLLYEGDDDIDTGDRLFLYRFGSEAEELFPTPLQDQDFNTPCAMSDGRIAFWESVPGEYLLRLYDPQLDTTETVYDQWLPFTGYVRCR